MAAVGFLLNIEVNGATVVKTHLEVQEMEKEGARRADGSSVTGYSFILSASPRGEGDLRGAVFEECVKQIDYSMSLGQQGYPEGWPIARHHGNRYASALFHTTTVLKTAA